LTRALFVACELVWADFSGLGGADASFFGALEKD